MARPLTIELNAEQRRELAQARDHHALPHVREKAAAILKIANGQSGRDVAFHGLLRHRRTETVYRWVHRYLAEGMAGLLVRGGRGRKPAFFPSAGRRDECADGAAACAAPRSTPTGL